MGLRLGRHVRTLVSGQGRNASPNLCSLATCEPEPSHVAMSSAFGTVALSTTTRTFEPYVRILETTHSMHAPDRGISRCRHS